MTLIIDLPQVGESVVEGIIGKWLKKPGDRLEKYDPLVEVVTDKVTMEVPSPVNGVLTRILVEEGATVPMGTPIAEIESEETQPAPTQPTAPAQAPPVPSGRATENVGTTGYLMRDERPVGPTGGGMEDGQPVESETRAPSVVSENQPPPVVASPVREPREERGRYSPAVLRLAREQNVDLNQVTGTGGGGRITRNDVLKHVEAGGGSSPSSPPAPAPRWSQWPKRWVLRMRS